MASKMWTRDAITDWVWNHLKWVVHPPGYLSSVMYLGAVHSCLDSQKCRQLFYLLRKAVPIDRRSYMIPNHPKPILQTRIPDHLASTLYCRPVDQYILRNIISPSAFNPLDLSNSKSLWISLNTVVQETIFKQAISSRISSKNPLNKPQILHPLSRILYRRPLYPSKSNIYQLTKSHLPAENIPHRPYHHNGLHVGRNRRIWSDCLLSACMMAAAIKFALIPMMRESAARRSAARKNAAADGNV